MLPLWGGVGLVIFYFMGFLIVCIGFIFCISVFFILVVSHLEAAYEYERAGEKRNKRILMFSFGQDRFYVNNSF